MTDTARGKPGESWDTIIVGQGLAGTALAWHLIEQGQRVLVIDAGVPGTTSKIAAGLITPITGQRLALSWRAHEMLSSARAFYPRIEQRTGTAFFHDRTAVRLFKNDIEREIWAKRRDQPAFKTFLSEPQPASLLDPAVGDDSGGGFQMDTAQLDVAGFLAASRAHFPYHTANLDWNRDVAIDDDGVTVLGHRAERVISCEGFAATRNPYFLWVAFKCAKGDILTIHFARPMPRQCLHRGIWIVPTSDPQIFRVGATYDWRTLDNVPSVSGRAEIEQRLREFIRVPYTVVNHQAAVRPIIRESKALIGLHPLHDRLGFFNGLGSKGALHAPWFADCFSRHLTHGAPLPEEFDLRRRVPGA